MSSQIEKRVNEISLLLVMTDASDPIGLDAILGIVDQIAEQVEKGGTHPRLKDACLHLKSVRENETGERFVAVVETFVSASLAYLNDADNVTFPHEQSDDGSSEKEGLKDIGENFDPEFLVEFIEKHNFMLEEFESTVVDFRFNRDEATPEEVGTFNSYIRSYLHNIKGDSGAIGLTGIELATHTVEDIVGEAEPTEELERLIAYREWVRDCLARYSETQSPTELSADFVERIKSGSAGGKQAAPAAAAPAITINADALAAASMLDDTPGKSESKPTEQEPTYLLTADPELFAEFAVEARDHLDNVESILLGATGPLDQEETSTAFRAVHSLKGASAYFNLKEINETSHTLENILDEVRDGKRTLDSQLTEVVFAYIDLQKNLLASARSAAESDNIITRTPQVPEFLKKLDHYIAVAAGEIPAEDVESGESASTEAAPAVDDSSTLVEDPKQGPAVRSKDKLAIKTFVKVDTDRLDQLIDSIGEMVIYSSMLIRSCRHLLEDNEDIIKTTHQVEKFSRDLQDIGMSMRLDPIKGLFQKMSRLVWDTSKKLGKDIAFTMQGEDTELDRTVIENLADPLMHMVRNAIDHGIEQPDEREANGKSRTGNVHLSAYHAGGSIHILIKDDGAGLDPVKLRNRAVEKGILTPEQHLTSEEAYLLIFAAGFSTAEAVTDISGRGVGMDVVRNNIESMRGRISIDSEVNKGSTFCIELPLTLAIMDGIETIVGSEHFIIPILSIIEFLRPTRQMISTSVGCAETFHFRGVSIPLFRLAELYEIEPRYANPVDATIIVVENSGERVALMVDGIVSTCQTVIKNLGIMFQKDKGVAGCAIMPNGNIGLILDVRTLVQLARSEYTHQYRLNDSNGVSNSLAFGALSEPEKRPHA